MHLDEHVIADYVDEALDAPARSAADRHLDTCAACRSVVEDLREIRRAATALEPRQPPARAWTRIERAIRLEADRPRRPRYAWLAAAAALVLATAAGLYFAAPRRPPAEPMEAVAAPSAQAVEAELREAESHYERAIQGLERIANAEQGAFDQATAATLQKNLAVIDQAISESRAAIRAQPASEPARDSLLTNFKTKLALLQDTVALINEMRKGNEAGTARIVSGLKQKGD
jgi:anti-sigma factor RsiW